MTSVDDPAERPPSPVDWVHQQLPGAVVTPVRARPWAEVWSVAGPSGSWWLKVSSAATGHEPRLLQLLADLGTPLVPAVSVHPSQPWALVRDAGHPVFEVAGRGAAGRGAAGGGVAGRGAAADVLGFWCGLLARYAELQQSVPPDRVLAVGVPDASPAALPGLLATLLDEPEWLSPAFAPELSDAERRRIRGCGPSLRSAAAALADGMPATLQHDDLHDANVFVPGPTLDPSRALVIDWGDASVSHPFGTLLVTLRALAAAWQLDVEDPQLARVRAAYLEAWRTRGESAAELDRQVELALRTAPLVRAASWRRALGTPQAGVALDMGAGTAHWLARLADALAVG